MDKLSVENSSAEFERGKAMYYIGIDISKFKHDCAVLDGNGDVVTPSWSFDNAEEGFHALLKLLEALDGEKRIGFEATGHYGLNLKLFLEANKYSFMEFNPVLVKRFVAGKTLRRTKTDPLDALSIAQYLRTVEYKPYPKSFYHYDALKSLTRFRENMIRQRSRQLVELTNIMDIIFPEFKPFFKNKFGATALYILANYGSPEKISHMNVNSYEILRKKSRGRFSAQDFAQLKHLASTTVGNTTDYLLTEMNTVLTIYSEIDAAVNHIEKEIQKLVLELETPILTVPGIGITSAAVILSEFGDFSRFKDPSKMLSFAGMEPGYFQSGTAESNGKMVKHGSSHLRYTLLYVCIPLIHSEPVFAQYYAKKRAEGKSHGVAITHVAKKLVRVLYTLQTKNIPYDPSLIR